MVYYFSGTGNSTFVATALANFLGMNKHFIPDVDISAVELPEENLLLVFPVYSWGVPPLITKFINDLGETFWERIKESNLSVSCVMTCGDEVGYAPEIIIKDLKRLGIELTSVWSVIMPNNYVLLPGFDVDEKQLEQSKLKSSERRILEIAQSLSRGDKIIDVTRGSFPWIKTKIVFPLFKRWGIFPKKWHFTSSCIGCGKCAEICPMLNVKMQEKHPVWGTRCCSCLGCYHVCPFHAVEYGKETKKKGQYLFPIKKISLRNYHN